MWPADTLLAKTLLESTDTFVRQFLDRAAQLAADPGFRTAPQSAMKTTPDPLGMVLRRCPKLREMLKKTAECPDLQHITDAYNGLTRNYRLLIEPASPEFPLSAAAALVVKDVFQYFYGDLLGDATYWKVYASQAKYRGLDDVRAHYGNAGRQSCPYCDMSDISNRDHSTTDHFLSQSQAPLLSVYWENLVFSCGPCNEHIKLATAFGRDADGVEKNVPVFHPYFHEPAKAFGFKFGKGFRPQLVINPSSSPDEQQRAAVWVRVFKLPRRYSTQAHILKSRCWLHLWSGVQRHFRSQMGVGMPDTEEVRNVLQHRLEELKDSLAISVGVDTYTKLLSHFFEHISGRLAEVADYFAFCVATGGTPALTTAVPRKAS